MSSPIITELKINVIDASVTSIPLCMTEKPSQKKDRKEPTPAQPKDMFSFIDNFSIPTSSKKRKLEKETKTLKPSHELKELNPYWKNDGMGIPQIEDTKYYEDVDAMNKCKYCWLRNSSKYIVDSNDDIYCQVSPNKNIAKYQFIIRTKKHYASSLELDNITCRKLTAYKYKLVELFCKEKYKIVFLEHFLKKKNDHFYIECIVLKKKYVDTADIYFCKAISDITEEWATNVSLIKVESYRELRSVIPKNFSFFNVNFNLQSGYVHVIENETKFDTQFGLNVLSGMISKGDNEWNRDAFDAQKMYDFAKKSYFK
ncbi:hypothetical protein A3Q56_01456 [Intoshia linei]|uniref:CWF19-like protein 2 n=1 Tax=Intoshia linei TaxID=1819745 RepID=A0A177BAT3_9BILA|nr:hypothetical protein A3Q56_01456 [Intoshia linei]